jgi:single-stranded-DNA-specific exonuclease
MPGMVWDVAPAPPPAALASLAPASPLLARLLWNRGVRDAATAQAFLAPLAQPLGEPTRMAGVTAAVERLRGALRRGERIALHGDYDVDGVAATAVLAETLERLGARPIVHIPHRVRDGYGLSAAAVRSLGEAGARVIVTVDCGITANAEVALATELGIDVVVTDHHHVPTHLPAAHAVLNPRQSNCDYAFRELSGVGVAYVLARALLEDGLPSAVAEASAAALLDLVALGTIADLVPLIGENRVLVARGLRALQALRRPGVAALMEVAGVRPDGLSAQRAAFTLIPRLNAAGRMGEASSAYALLTAADRATADPLAAALNAANRERQQAVGAGEARAREAADPTAPAIVVAGEYPLGVAGLIAGRLVEETGCPAIVLERGAEYCKGSARGPHAFHLAEALAACSDLLVKYGGHAQAAGLTLRTSHLAAFEERFRALASTALGPQRSDVRLAIDGQVSLREFNWDALQVLRALEPCGMGNGRPLFLTHRVELREARPLGETGVALRLREGGQTMRASAFRLGDRLPPPGSLVSVVYEVEWRVSGEQGWGELSVRDVQPAGA